MINLNQSDNSSRFVYEPGDYPEILDRDYEIIEGISRTGFKETYKVKNVPGNNEEILAHVFTLPQSNLIENASDLLGNRIEYINSLDCPSFTPVLCRNMTVSDDYINVGIVYNTWSNQPLASRISLNATDHDLVSNRMSSVELRKTLLALCDAVLEIHAFNDRRSDGRQQWHLGLNPYSVLFIDDEIRLTDVMLEYLTLKLVQGSDNTDSRWDLLWSAPEVIRQTVENIGPGSDIWSFGIIMYQLMGEAYPFAGNSVARKLVNICASSDNKKRLDFLPVSLGKILTKCLEKDPLKRYQSFDGLRRDLQTAEFTKTCGAREQHENEYYAQKCDCGMGFSHLVVKRPYSGQETKWFQPPQLPDTLLPGTTEFIELNLHLMHHEDFHKFKNTGKKIRIAVRPKNGGIVIDDIIIPFLPPPKFDIVENQITAAYDPSIDLINFDIQLQLVESEAVIEKITALIGDIRVPESNVVFNAAMSEIKKGNPELPVRISVPQDLLELDHPNEISLILQLKNRKDPLTIDQTHIGDTFTFTLTNPPTLVFIPNREFIQVEVFCGEGVNTVSRRINLGNTGNSRIEINSVEIGIETDGDALQQPEFIKTVNHDGYIDPEDTGDIQLVLEPSKLSDRNDIHVIKIVFQYFYNEKWEEKIISKRINFSTRTLIPGELLAVDFGTTNTYCAAIKESIDPDAKAVHLSFSENNSDGVIPSVIKYAGLRDFSIGIGPQRDFFHGQPNVFKSFKRQFASQEKLFAILTGSGKSANYEAEQLIKDYIGKLIEAIKVEHGFEFKHFVFTHPSNMDVNQRKRFVRMLQDIDIDPARCVFIDEACSSAIYSIMQHHTEWVGKYRLVVYDFGGGTTDLTYFLVENDSGIYTIDTVDISGLPEFGGDDLTEIVFDQCISSILENYLGIENQTRDESLSLLLPADFQGLSQITYDPRFEKECRHNLGHLKIEADRLKILMSQSDENEQIRSMGLYFFDGRKKVPDQVRVDVFVKKEQFLEKAREELKKSIQTTIDMFVNNERELSENYIATPVHLVLSGRSSALPLVKEMFQEIIASEKMNIADITHSDLLKECVAKGASYYYFSQSTGADFIRIKGGEGVNQIRIGLRDFDPTGGTGPIPMGFVFKELVSVNTKLIPDHMEMEKLDLGYAVNEIDYKFSFDSDGRLNQEIELFQHSGSNSHFSQMVCTSIGKYDLKKKDADPGATATVNGRLRVAVYEGSKIKVKAKINGQWHPLVRV
ncbi:protein kinase domain-containing protein [Desulfobacter latus]|uniref:Protein kinase n=1 Tax=Desulfobacter latus TaxID=2292 RepID=A0A850TBA2_9BACT|nr:protein kinase [Desulfobacter latus]NWH05908.1 protein kinase [Desulfobacter latus]